MHASTVARTSSPSSEALVAGTATALSLLFGWVVIEQASGAPAQNSPGLFVNTPAKLDATWVDSLPTAPDILLVVATGIVAGMLGVICLRAYGSDPRRVLCLGTLTAVVAPLVVRAGNAVEFAAVGRQFIHSTDSRGLLIATLVVGACSSAVVGVCCTEVTGSLAAAAGATGIAWVLLGSGWAKEPTEQLASLGRVLGVVSQQPVAMVTGVIIAVVGVVQATRDLHATRRWLPVGIAWLVLAICVVISVWSRQAPSKVVGSWTE